MSCARRSTRTSGRGSACRSRGIRTGPCMLDYVERLFTEFTELHGDRRFADDKAIVTGFGFFHDEPVVDRRTPEGPRHEAEDLPQLRLREARGLPQGASRHAAGREVQAAGDRRSSTRRRPIRASSPRSAASPKRSRSICARWRCSTCRSSCSSAARAAAAARSGIAVGDRVLMQEFSVYSVIPPEGCAAILWRDAGNEGRGGRGAQDHGAGPAGAGAHRRDREGTVGRRAPRLRRGAAALVDEALAASSDGARSAMDPPKRASTRGIRSSARWARSGQAFVDDDGARRRPAAAGLMQRRVWEDVPADDARVAATAAALGGAAGHRAAAVPARARRSGRRETLPRIRDSTSCTIRFCSPACATAVDRLLGAVARRERIAIHGDYDVDGITSTVILRRAIELLGGDVVHFVPDRLRDGYGLQPATIERLAARRRAGHRVGRLRHSRDRGGRCARASSASI